MRKGKEEGKGLLPEGLPWLEADDGVRSTLARGVGILLQAVPATPPPPPPPEPPELRGEVPRVNATADCGRLEPQLLS